MPGAVWAHISAARFAIDLRGNFAKNRRDHFPGFARAARHERRTFERPFFPAGNAAADKMNAAPFQIFAATLRVGEERIAAIDDDVAFFEQRSELPNDGIDRRARLYHDHRFARSFKRADEFLDRARGLDIFSFAPAPLEFLRDFRGAIKNGDQKSLRFHVQDEVLAHHSQADQANITLIRGHFEVSFP